MMFLMLWYVTGLVCFKIMFLSAFALAQGCKSVKTGYVSHDEEAHLSYISTQQPHIPQIFTRMRQACIRSLSCEVSNFCFRFYCQCIALSSLLLFCFVFGDGGSESGHLYQH